MKKRSGLVFVLLAITAVAIITVVLLRNYFMYYSAEEVMIDWGELFSQTPGQGGVTIIGYVIYSEGDEFILDVVRQDGPTVRAPSLYHIADFTKVWQRNRWMKLKKTPEVGSAVIMHVPWLGDHSNQVAGIELLDLDLIDGDLENIEKWSGVTDILGRLIKESRALWEKEGLEVVDIQVDVTAEGIELTGFDKAHKGGIAHSICHFYTSDGEFISSEKFLPFDMFDIQVEYAGDLYMMKSRYVSLSDLDLGEDDLEFIGRDFYYRYRLYSVKGQNDYLISESGWEGMYHVWEKNAQELSEF
ncbi:MAG: hypothetical protein QM371_02490 [Bacillota bacterium]|nr:hypothetical protein [Bacillota bacterium]